MLGIDLDNFFFPIFFLRQILAFLNFVEKSQTLRLFSQRPPPSARQRPHFAFTSFVSCLKRGTVKGKWRCCFLSMGSIEYRWHQWYCQLGNLQPRYWRAFEPGLELVNSRREIFETSPFEGWKAAGTRSALPIWKYWEAWKHCDLIFLLKLLDLGCWTGFRLMLRWQIASCWSPEACAVLKVFCGLPCL